MAKYIIETDDENSFELNGWDMYRVKGFPWMVLSESDLEKLETIEDGFLDHVELTGYHKGVRDAIEAAVKIGKMDENESLRVFGKIPPRVMKEVDPLEIVKMLKEHEKNMEIEVGDEVLVGDPELHRRAIVTGVDGMLCSIVYADGSTDFINKRIVRLTRTGRRSGSIKAILEEMQS